MIDHSKVLEVLEQRAEGRVELKALGRPRRVVLEREPVQRHARALCRRGPPRRKLIERHAWHQLRERLAVKIFGGFSAPGPAVLRPPARQHERAACDTCDGHRALEARKLVAHAGKRLVNEEALCSRGRWRGVVVVPRRREPRVHAAIWVRYGGRHVGLASAAARGRAPIIQH